MNVAGLTQRGVSTMYVTVVGYLDANASVMMVPDALQLKTSIWPGVSTKTYFTEGARFSTNCITWSNRVANRLREVRIPPFGPRLYLRAKEKRMKICAVGAGFGRAEKYACSYCFITSLYLTESRMSMFGE